MNRLVRTVVHLLTALFLTIGPANGAEPETPAPERKPDSVDVQEKSSNAPPIFQARDPSGAGWLRTGIGYYNFSRNSPAAAEFRLEYFTKFKLWIIQPFLGMSYTSTADFYGFLGIGIDFYFTQNLYLLPTFALGYYKHTRGIDLGFPLQFREGIELGWHFDNDIRVAATLVHMSNSQLGATNPGQETISLMVSLPISFDRWKEKRTPASEQANTCPPVTQR
jgi:lipid A 3-O-deacylase